MTKPLLVVLVAVAAATLLLDVAATAERRRHDDEYRESSRTSMRGLDHEMLFEPLEAETLFESEAGRIVQWGGGSRSMLTNMGLMDARLVTLNQPGSSLLLPQYANSHRLLAMLKGCARMGLMLPFGKKANVRHVTEGEVVAVPRGFPFWMLNDGKEPCHFFTAANIGDPMMHGRHKYEAFHLAGSSHPEMGGILQGFSSETLAAALDVDEDIVRKMMESQDEAAIVRVREREIALPRATKEEQAAEFLADFTFHLERAHPDFLSDKAGKFTIANSLKLPVLKHMDMAIGCLRLEPNAMLGPGWATNTDELIFCVEGSANIQIVMPNGTQACNEDMRKGSVMMVPKNYPYILRAGDDGFAAAISMNHHMPICMHAVGESSVFRNMPRQIRMESFGVDRETDEQLCEARRDEIAILAPSAHGQRRRGGRTRSREGQRDGGKGKQSLGLVEQMLEEAMWAAFDL